MTTKQQSELDRALARASAADLHITGQGHLLNGQRFFLIPSATDSARSHIIVSDETRLHCDCEAGQRDHVCMHRAIVHLFLRDERTRKAANDAAVVQALAASDAEAAERHLTPAPKPTTRGQRNGPKLRTDTRAFSIFR
jgi:hypothetical protein